MRFGKNGKQFSLVDDFAWARAVHTSSKRSYENQRVDCFDLAMDKPFVAQH